MFPLQPYITSFYILSFRCLVAKWLFSNYRIRMYFHFELDFSSDKRYISGLIEASAQKIWIDLQLRQDNGAIRFSTKKDDPLLEPFLQELESVLPASLFMGKSRKCTRWSTLKYWLLELMFLATHLMTSSYQMSRWVGLCCFYYSNVLRTIVLTKTFECSVVRRIIEALG